MTDESTFTPWGAGWTAENRWSPEEEWCDFVNSWVMLHRPHDILETGAGSGRVSREIVLAMAPDARFVVYESDPEWRERVTERLQGFDNWMVSEHETPTSMSMSVADLAVLDSGNHRPYEIALWAAAAKPGAYALVHDASIRHHQEGIRSTHRKIWETVWKTASTGVKVVPTPNPRGGAILWKEA